MLKRLLIAWAGNGAALCAAAGLLEGISYGDDWWVLVVAALVFSLINAVVRPVLLLLSLPLIVLTLGIALFVVNLLMLGLTSALVDGFEIDGFWAAVGGTIVVWLVNWLLSVTLFRGAEKHR